MQKCIRILRIINGEAGEVEDTVVNEHSATIYLNKKQVVTLLCSPAKLDYMAVGFLFNEGIITGNKDIAAVTVNADGCKSMIQVEAKTTGNINNYDTRQGMIASSGEKYIPQGSSYEHINRKKISSEIKITPSEVTALMDKFHKYSPVFTATGGVHSAALCSNEDILVFCDDIGRHNAMNKMMGECLMKNIPTDNHIVITSGRISSEILAKIAGINVPIIMSVSAPTDIAVEMAEDMNITLIAFIRGNKMNVYTHNWRVISNDRR